MQYFLQMTQDMMTILQYFDAFEPHLAQLEDYDESILCGEVYFWSSFFDPHSGVCTASSKLC